MKPQILIGADPELFAYKGDNFLSVHDILPGTKNNPVKVPNGAIQVDGVAAEFNIDPAANETVFYTNVVSVRSFLQNFLRINSPGTELLARPTATFDKEYFDSLPDYVKALGCEPDFSAYTKKPNPKPETDQPFRTGSGHVHIGWTEKTEEEIYGGHFLYCCDLVQELDATIYPVSYLWDDDTSRRQLYGMQGSFRPKKYGLEYRVLSNAWVESEWATRYVYKLVHNVTERFLNGDSTKTALEKMGQKSNSLSDLFERFELLGLPLPPPEVIEVYNKIG